MSENWYPVIDCINYSECQMDSYIISIVLEGKLEVTVNNNKAILSKNQFLITEPSTISM
jgi:hypothetical protein